MPRGLLRSFAAALVAASLTACGGGGDADESGAQGDGPRAWMADACEDVSTWSDDLDALATKLQEDVGQSRDAPASTRRAFLVFLDQASDRTRGLRGDISGRPAPDLPGGRELVADIQGEFDRMVEGFDQARLDAERIPRRRGAAYDAALEEVEQELRPLARLRNPFVVLGHHDEAALDAFIAAPECRPFRKE